MSKKRFFSAFRAVVDARLRAAAERAIAVLALGAVAACGSPKPQPQEETSATGRVPGAEAASDSSPDEPEPSGPAVPPPPEPPPPPEVPVDIGRDALYVTGGPPPDSCSSEAGRAALGCFVEARYAEDPLAQKDAVQLFEELGIVAGLEQEQDFDGGFRGVIHLVPALPIGPQRRHLAWVRTAMQRQHDFVEAVRSKASAPIEYRVTGLLFRFFRSVGRTTPSAYASGWRVAYNLSGSLHASSDAVDETLFHEVFHLNDADHEGWSNRALATVFGQIRDRCGQNTACLTPYAPNKTMLKGGSYYAFHDGPSEYAAELAVRYYVEQRAALEGRPMPPAFKCQTEENRLAYEAFSREFFGGHDATECSP